MEILINILTFGFGVFAGFFIADVLIGSKLRMMFEERMEDDLTPDQVGQAAAEVLGMKGTPVAMIMSLQNEHLYAHSPTGEFLCYGKNLEQVNKRFEERFPGSYGMIIDQESVELVTEHEGGFEDHEVNISDKIADILRNKKDNS